MRQREAAADEERRRKAAAVREALSRKVLLHGTMAGTASAMRLQ